VRAGHDEERAEAALRHEVGEFSDEQWNEVRARVDAALEGLESEDAILRTQRDDVERLLASAVVGAAPEVVAPAPAEPEAPVTLEHDEPAADGPEAPETAPEADAVIAVLADPAPVAVQVATPTPVSIHDLFGVGSTVVSEPTPETAIEPTHDDEIEAAWQESAARGFDLPTESPRVTQEVAALERFEVYTGPNPAVTGATAADPAPPVAEQETEVPAQDEGVTGSATAFDDLAFLRSLSVSPEQTKTLRCTECNTMNFPTEWYCERCGGELAAL
jgi:hypothetical protein